MQIIDDYHFSDSVQITWGVLFPRSFCNELKKRMGNYEIYKYLHPGEGEEMQKVLVRMLLPEEYRKRRNGADITDKDKSQFNKYYNTSGFAGMYGEVTKHILIKASTGNYNFYSFPLLRDLNTNLKTLFSFFPEEYIEKYKNDIRELIALHFDQHKLLKRHKQTLLRCDFFDQLTCLTAVAVTWPSWNDADKQAEDLSYFLIPIETANQSTVLQAEQRIHNYVAGEKNKAAVCSQSAHAFYNQSDYHAAADLFARIIRINLADYDILGDAYYYLALCIMDHGYLYSDEKGKRIRPVQLLSEACHYGSSLALDRLRIEKGEPEPVHLIRKLPDTHGTARIILNCQNNHTNVFLESLPKEMREKDIRERMIHTASSPDTLIREIKQIDFHEDCRFLLFDDDSRKNFQDLLYILDFISSWEKPRSKEETISALMRWHKTSIYIRVKEEEYAALIDTALKRLGDFTIRVLIIDDNKWTAEYLLYQQPLFHPIKYIPVNHLTKNTPLTLNFTIISDQNTELTCWLIREAFWLGCFYYEGITLSVHVISPNAKKIERILRFECPGIFGELPGLSSTSKIVINEFRDIESIASDEVFCRLKECKNSMDGLNYYVVNTGDSIRNLNFAIKLREWTIRERIDSKTRLQNRALPFIAFWCPDSLIAHLSRHMVVQTVDNGDQWFNNYNVIPFGMLEDRYSWNQLDGGYLEDVAESTHLQYCQAEVSDSLEAKLIHLKSYFSRSYNRDSSMAVALSMPYRLFQAKTDLQDHILSRDRNPSTDTPPSDAEELAELFQKNHSANAQNLLIYEHSRWLRWAVSRGWKRADASQVIHYMKDGNPKHQLYIARLHGCICDLNELKTLADSMREEAYTLSDSKKASRFARKYITDGALHFEAFDFEALDRSNIKATGDIITAKWLPQISVSPEADAEKSSF